MSETVRITCCKENCGTFPMDAALVQKLKRTGDTWTCPAGHQQHFTESPNQQLRDRISELEATVESLQVRNEDLDETASAWYDSWRVEKERRKRLETLVLDRITGIIEVGEDECKWACACGGRGKKAFEDPEDCRDAWQQHRRREGCGEAVPEDVIEA